MSIQELGSLGEFIAAIATLITLVYLALQIRHNTLALDEAARRAAAEDASRFRDKLIENADVARLYREGSLNPESLDSTERLRFRMLLDELFFTWQYQHGARVGIEVGSDFIRATLKSPGGAAYWKRARSHFSSDFVDHIDGLVVAAPDGTEPRPSVSRDSVTAAQQGVAAD